MARRAHRRASDGVTAAAADTIAVGLGLGCAIALDLCAIALARGSCAIALGSCAIALGPACATALGSCAVALGLGYATALGSCAIALRAVSLDSCTFSLSSVIAVGPLMWSGRHHADTSRRGWVEG